jgi:hypothetical protein
VFDGSRRGKCWDKAVAESVFDNLKNEGADGRRYATRDEAPVNVFD